MEEGQNGHHIGSALSNKLADGCPAVYADDFMEVDSGDESRDEARNDIERDIKQFRTDRANAARTLYQFRRADNDTINSTRSLYDSDVVYYNLHGRRYCGEYYMPNDEDEQTRMQMMHSVYLYLFDQRLTTVPLVNPTKILDIGTGCGEWAMAMGDEYPEAEIIGTDIAKIQPTAVPLNVFFEIDDAEEEGGWAYAKDDFDLIHFRTMMGAFTDWSYIYKESFRHLKPGGWIEVTDFDDHKAMMKFFPPGSVVEPWLKAIGEGSLRAGRPRGIKHLDHEMLTKLGFVDVVTEEYDIPMGIWPSDPEEKKIGKLFMIAQLCGVEALCLRVLTEQMGWDPAEVHRMCDIVTTDVKEIALDATRAKGLGFKLRVLKGRKPTLEQQDYDNASESTVKDGETGLGKLANGV